jgi:putative transcriptional regulator
VIRVRLAELLQEQEKSQYWLANETGLSPLTISKLVKGKTNGIGFTTLELICEALKCEPNDLLQIEKTKKVK